MLLLCSPPTKLLVKKDKVLRILMATIIRFLNIAPQWFNCDMRYQAVLQNTSKGFSNQNKSLSLLSVIN